MVESRSLGFVPLGDCQSVSLFLYKNDKNRDWSKGGMSGVMKERID